MSKKYKHFMMWTDVIVGIFAFCVLAIESTPKALGLAAWIVLVFAMMSLSLLFGVHTDEISSSGWQVDSRPSRDGAYAVQLLCIEGGNASLRYDIARYDANWGWQAINNNAVIAWNVNGNHYTGGNYLNDNGK